MKQKEITEIENAAVTNFAEMLCDYASGLDEGEGIGREDVIAHLYEYINGDKRFTREPSTVLMSARKYIDFLNTHNKNYTKSQWEAILDLKEIIDNIEE